MSIQSLNYDVMEAILSFVEPRDALPLTATCQALHVPATRRLLSEVFIDWEVGAGGSSQMEKKAPAADTGVYNMKGLLFCEYMLRDIQNRPQCLKALYLHRSERPSWRKSVRRPKLVPFHERITEVIPHATTLRTLYLDARDARKTSFTENRPSLADALANVQSLETIRFHCRHTSDLALLCRMKSQPRTVWCSSSWQSFEPSRQLSRFLHNFVERLTTLRIRGVHDIMLANAQLGLVWPRVKELAIQDQFIMDKYWQILPRAFPNLRSLRVVPWSVTTVDADLEWSELDVVCTRSLLPLRCRVRSLELASDLNPHILPAHRYVASQFDMLRRAMPVVLTCHYERQILELVPKHLGSLKVLHLTEYAGWWRATGANDHRHLPEWTSTTLRHIASALASSRIRAVIIELPHNATIRKAQLRSHAENIATHAGSLELIGIHLYGFRNRRLWPIERLQDWRTSLCNWYHVTSRNTDGTPCLTIVPKEDVLLVVPQLLQSFQGVP
ncbi:uncharacterized protein C8Q71DRAFT_789362 [Rhodofomes roseus]|uniref:F-box domain-containing protein n=1 Tax=Rhodofomes roseus TaxID=34475 RepID=A0ABQ8JZC1_9APHY|nr:uncharacterized protein C8Q71DRAFT_789362 [Rhodofomes roseus]KAH9829654.1 hypothetical protein C8Q71DRAFT_789362 [Rhodofomes roseus]